MRKIVKKSLATVLSLSLALGLVACNQNTQKETGKTTDKKPGSEQSTGKKDDGKTSKENQDKIPLRIMYWNKQETMQSFLDLVKKKLPQVDLEFQFVPVGELDSIVSAQLQAGEGPDILPSGTSEAYAKAGYLVDLSNEDFMKNFDESALDLISINGKQYGIPGLSWYEGMFYNKTIFEENGLKPPKSFEELMQLHKALKDKGIKPQAMGANSWEPMMKSSLGFAIAEWLRTTEDGKTFDQGIREGTKTFSGSKLKENIEIWDQYIEDGYLTPDMLEVSYDEALVEFATGKAAMWESGPWAVEAIKKTNPDLKFDMFPFYGTKGDEGWLVGGPGVTFGINSASKNQDAAKEVLALMASPEGQKALLENNPGSGSFGKDVKVELPEYFQGVKEVLSSGRTYCPWFVWSTNNNPYIETYGKGLQEYLQGNMTIDEVLAQVDEVAKADHELK